MLKYRRNSEGFIKNHQECFANKGGQVLAKENIIFFTKEDIQRFKMRLRNPFNVASYILLIIGAPLLLIGTFMSKATFWSVGSVIISVSYMLLPSFEDWKNEKMSNKRMFFLFLTWLTGSIFIVLLPIIWE